MQVSGQTDQLLERHSSRTMSGNKKSGSANMRVGSYGMLNPTNDKFNPALKAELLALK